MAKVKKKYSNPELNSIYNRIESCNQTIKLLKIEISEAKQVSQELKSLSSKVSEIEATYRRNNVSQMLKLNLGYKAEKEKIHVLKSKLGQFSLEHLIKQLADENKNLVSLNKNFEETEIKLKKILTLKQIEDKYIKKPKRKKAPTAKSEKIDMSKKKQKVVARVERFKSSSGGSSTALTSRSSTWTVKKR